MAPLVAAGGGRRGDRRRGTRQEWLVPVSRDREEELMRPKRQSLTSSDCGKRRLVYQGEYYRQTAFLLKSGRWIVHESELHSVEMRRSNK